MNPWPDLRSILGDVPWVIAGGVATRATMPERATKDVDVLVRREDGEEALARLEAAGYSYVSPRGATGCLLHSPEGVEIDVAWGDHAWLDEALAHPRQDPAGYPVADLGYLVLAKMAVFRGQDMADVSRMLGLASDEELARVREIVGRYAPGEAADLESLIYLSQVEMGKAPAPGSETESHERAYACFPRVKLGMTLDRVCSLAPNCTNDTNMIPSCQFVRFVADLALLPQAVRASASFASATSTC